jgi:hypothetical protein
LVVDGPIVAEICSLTIKRQYGILLTYLLISNTEKKGTQCLSGAFFDPEWMSDHL